MPVPAGGDGLPVWAPSLQEVADYCTARTLVPQTDGSNLEQPGFSGQTRPTDTLVTRLIADAVGWVQLKTGDLDASLYGQGNMVATVRTAAFVELRFPERQSQNRDDAITTAKELLKQADQMRADLAAANEAVTGTDPEDPAAHLMPVWSFPAAPVDYYPY